MNLHTRSFLSFAIVACAAAACAGSSSVSPGSEPMPSGANMSMTAPSPDPRVGLHAGWMNAGEASWNLQMVSHVSPSSAFINPSTPGDGRLFNTDLAFTGSNVIQGNYSGYQVWDISNAGAPTLKTAYVCPGSQSDVSVFRNLMFVSGEATSGRLDCGTSGVQDPVSKERLRGIRIFDMTDIAHPKYLTNVQTCRGSHTHTVVTDPNDNANVYIYISGTSTIRSSDELAGCIADQNDPNTAYFRIEVIQIPLAHPEQAKIVSSPRIFADAVTGAMNGLATPTPHATPVDPNAPARGGGRGGRGNALDTTAAGRGRGGAAGDSAAGGRGGRGGRGGGAAPAARPTGLTQCHDITVYPAVGLAGGACAGMGLLLDIRDVAHPKRIGEVADSNFSFWHSATFSNDGSKILFSDEWGGGTAPRCRPTDKMEWGADAIFTLNNNKLTFQSYYKMPAAQTSNENCVAHNGSLVPIPGRDIMVQAWYQGGISVFDWTDPAHPKEIAYFDRGPMDSTKLVTAGYWSAYWYNGYIVGSEISRGLDLFRLTPSGLLSQNEIDAANLVHFDFLNVQDQPKIVWPANFAVPRAYLDQLVRGNGISRDRSTAIARDLNHAQQLSGAERKAALTTLATQLDADAQSAGDRSRVRAMSAAVKDLANAQR